MSRATASGTEDVGGSRCSSDEDGEISSSEEFVSKGTMSVF